MKVVTSYKVSYELAVATRTRTNAKVIFMKKAYVYFFRIFILSNLQDEIIKEAVLSLPLQIKNIVMTFETLCFCEI